MRFRLDKVFREAKTAELKEFLQSITSRLDEIQKDVIRHRWLMLSLGGMFTLLAADILSLSKIPGLDVGEIKLVGLPSVNALVLCGIPLLFGANYYLFIHCLLYRSQLRFLHFQLYKKLYPVFYDQNFHQYTMPHSPGHISKTMNKISSSQQGEEQKGSVYTKLRSATIWVEIGFHWVFMAWAIMYIFRMFWNEETAFLLLIVAALSIVAFLLGFSHAVKYNNYFNIFNKDFEKFKAGFEA